MGDLLRDNASKGGRQREGAAFSEGYIYISPGPRMRANSSLRNLSCLETLLVSCAITRERCFFFPAHANVALLLFLLSLSFSLISSILAVCLQKTYARSSRLTRNEFPVSSFGVNFFSPPSSLETLGTNKRGKRTQLTREKREMNSELNIRSVQKCLGPFDKKKQTNKENFFLQSAR